MLPQFSRHFEEENHTVTPPLVWGRVGDGGEPLQLAVLKQMDATAHCKVIHIYWTMVNYKTNDFEPLGYTRHYERCGGCTWL